MFETLLLHIMVAADTIWTQKKKKKCDLAKNKSAWLKSVKAETQHPSLYRDAKADFLSIVI